MVKRRIIRADSLNWAIQEWQEGGGIIERGRFVGQTKKAKWKMPESFFRTLADAAASLLHDIIGDVPTGEVNLTGKQLSEQVSKAEQEVKLYVNTVVASMKTDALIGILQERGYAVTDGKKGRKTLADNEAPEEES
jgi:hypothetical protein